jgi:hypothetical protein
MRACACTHAHSLSLSLSLSTVLNDTTNAPTCFGASAPSSGGFDIVFAKIIKY